MTRDPFDFFNPAKFIEWQGETRTAAELADAIESRIDNPPADRFSAEPRAFEQLQFSDDPVLKQLDEKSNPEKTTGLEGGVAILGNVTESQPPVGSATAAPCVIGITCDGRCAECQVEPTFEDMRRWDRQ